MIQNAARPDQHSISCRMGPWIRSLHANCIRPVIRNDPRGNAAPIPLPSRDRLGQGVVKRPETR